MSERQFDPMTDLGVKPLRFYDRRSGREMIYVYPDTKHWTAGWICYKHPDGQFVTLRKATDADIKTMRSAYLCEHGCGRNDCPSCCDSIEASPAEAPAPAQPSDVCWCGDYRSEHQGDGPCRVCENSRAPYDGCKAFRLSRSANEGEQKHWDEFHGPKAGYDGEDHAQPAQPTPAEPSAEQIGDKYAEIMLDNLRHNVAKERKQLAAVAPASEEEVARKHWPEDWTKYPSGRTGKMVRLDRNESERKKGIAAIHEVADPLQKQVETLEQWKREALVSLGAWDTVTKFLRDHSDVKELGGTWQEAVLNRLRQLELCREIPSQFSKEFYVRSDHSYSGFSIYQWLRAKIAEMEKK